MRKITDFIVNHRKLVLIVVIILTIFCGYLSTKVSINSDMTRYLPDSSETKTGLDIMEDEFSDSDTSSLLVMFANLEEEEKKQIQEELENIEYVESVDYELDSEEYNKDEYTLYSLTVDYPSDSDEAGSVYDEILEKYEDYEIYTDGDIADDNAPVLETWVILLAVFCAMIILIIMSSSFVEPFLFLFVILLAIILNAGTNIIFDNVSNITNSISAILQMALSMDYSIMLINRYRQEKVTEKDNVKAMKNALYNAAKSISSSSVTTIVGLAMLIFMSFTIGKDLGLVLAKGVLMSLLCIFTCLPGLILMFDKLITKTHKKAPEFRLNKLGNFIYKARHVGALLFIVIFAGSFILRGNLGYEFVTRDANKIDEVFPENNQIAIVYKSEYEDEISELLADIENQENVDEVLGYGNTINEELKYDELNAQLEDLGSDTEIEDYLLKIIYYNYYSGDEEIELTFEEFVSFIKSDILNNENFSSQIDDDMESEIDNLSNFTNKESIYKERTISELSEIFDIDEENIELLLIYYNSKNVTNTMTISEFVNFVNEDVLQDSTYSENIDDETKESLETLSQFTDKSTINTKMTYKQISSLFGIDESLVEQLFTYYATTCDIDTTLTIHEFAEFVLEDVATNSDYSSLIDESTLENIQLLYNISDTTFIETEMSADEIANIFGINEDIVTLVSLLKYSQSDNGTTMTMIEFIQTVAYLKENTTYLDDVDVSQILALEPYIDSNDTTEYTSTQIASLFGVDSSSINQIYALSDYINGNTSTWEMTLYEFIEIIIENSSNENVANNLTEDMLDTISLCKTVMDSSKKGKEYTYSEISSIIGIDEDIAKSIYSLKYSQENTIKMTPINFVKFILNNQNSDILKGNLDNETLENLTLLNKVMNGVNKNTSYTYTDLADLLGMESSDMSLLYSLYSYKYIDTNPKISIKEFTEFILEDVANNETYSDQIDSTAISKLEVINVIMNSTINNTKYTSSKLYEVLSSLTDSMESNLIDLVYLYYGSENEYNYDWTLTVEELVNYINDDILQDDRFSDFIDDEMNDQIVDAQDMIDDAKEMLVGDEYSRIVINTSFDLEGQDVYDFIEYLKNNLSAIGDEIYVAGDSSMSYELNQTFTDELNYITIITMIAIFIVVACTFKSILLPLILVLVIQCAVFLTMGALAVTGDNVYFIAILVVQSILMGATIDYAIVFTSYYLESRQKLNVRTSLINSYNKAMHTILTSASVFIIVTIIVGKMTTGITSKICTTIALGTFCSSLLIVFILPTILSTFDKIIVRKKKK